MRYLRMLTVLVAMLAASSMSFVMATTEKAAVDGIWYNLDNSDYTATVTFQGSTYYEYLDEYTGDIVIPASVEYNSQTYTVKAVGFQAFTQCSGLTSVVISEGVQRIESHAFGEGCGVRSVTIPNSVTSLPDVIFSACAELTDVYVSWTTNETILTPYSGFNAMSYGNIRLHFPSVDYDALYYKNKTPWKDMLLTPYGTCGANLTWELQGDTLTISGSGPMTDYAGANDVPWFYFRAQDYYSKNYVKYINLPDGLTTISPAAFHTCSNITSIDIPSSVTSIGNQAFNGCTNLADVIVHWDNLSGLTLGENLFNSYPIATLHVPYGTLANYNTASPWSSFVTINEMLTTMDDIYTVAVAAGYTPQTKDVYFSDKWVISGMRNANAYMTDGTKGFALSIASGEGEYAIHNRFRGLNTNAQVYFVNNACPYVGTYTSKMYSLQIADSVITPHVKTIAELDDHNCGALVTLENLVWNGTNFTDGVNTIKPLDTYYDYTASVTTGKHYDVTGVFTMSSGKSILPRSAAEIVEAPSGQCGDNLYWLYSPATHTLTITGTGAMWELDHYGGNHPWFSYRHDITTLTIEDGATYIAENAFSEFTSLVSETLPSSVTSLGAAAFSDCSALTSLTLPSGLTTIGEWGFSNSGLTSLNIPAGVTTLAEGLFDGCTSLGTVTFADGSLLTTIGIEAFLGCSSLASITIPASVTQISARAFKNCSNLVSVTFADGSLLTTIGIEAFLGCTSLASIAIPAHVTQVGESAFKSCTDLATVTIADGSASLEIRSGAFGATAITAIDIPERVTGIANVAFYKCASLADVTVHWTSAGDLPAVGVTNVFGDIAPGASLHIPCGCASVYEATAPWSSFSLVEPCVGGQCGDNLYWQYNTVTHELAITGTDDMWNYSYSISTHPWVDYRAEITSVSLPDGMTSIGSSAFYKCTGITSITIPSTVVSIGREAFAYSGLTSITIPDGVTSISRSMFTECQALVSVNLPSGVTSIGVAAFYHCSVLASINLPEGLTSIELTAFNTCSSLTTITFPASLTTIEQSAFAYSGLTSIDIPAGVTTIGNQTFYRCTDLTDATVHWTNMEGISVASNAFYNTASSKTLHIPCGTTSIYSGTDPWSDFSTKVEYGCPVASVTTSGSVTTNYTTFAAALAAWEANSTLTLLDNVVISDRIEVTEAKTLDLNGYGIKNDGGLHEVIYIHGSSAHLTLEDSNPDAPHKYDYNSSNLLATLNEASGANTVLGGYITGGNGNTTETNIYAGNNMANGGGIFVYDGATFTMNGGNIIGNRTHAISGREARHGGGVFVAKNSHFILNGGRITHNYAQYGGGVAVYGSTSDVPEQGPSDMVMTGGEISYNFATTNCGGISTNGRNAHITLTITGGTITENRLKPTATQRAGGIGFDTNMTFNLSGNPTIDDNYNASGAEENIYIGTGRMITITGDLTNTTPIGITMVTPGVFTSGLNGHGVAANFSSDDASKTVVLNHANEMALIGDANYERSSLFAGKIGTLYTGHATAYYEGATFYTIYGRNEDKTQLYFEEVTGELGDNTTYIFESAGDAIALYYADPSFVPQEEVGQNGLFGTLVGKTIDQNPEIYYIADNQLWSAASFAGSVTQLTVEANRCWIAINYVPYKAAPSPAPGKRYITLGTNGAMGIEGIESRESKVESQESGVQKILRDGQIYILREGKRYNILGF